MNKFLCDYKSEQEPRETYEPMVRLGKPCAQADQYSISDLLIIFAALHVLACVGQRRLSFIHFADYVVVRTPGVQDEEVILRLQLLPLRLNVDQVY
jgi:hypothetical protein